MTLPKPTYIYFMRPLGCDGPIKIGISNRPLVRLDALARWSPEPLELITTIPGNFSLESNIHDCFADLHSHHEWFHASPALIEFVRKVASGVPVAEAIDLSKRVISIRGKRRIGVAYWHRATA